MEQQAWRELIASLENLIGASAASILQTSEIEFSDGTLTYTVPYLPIVEKDGRHELIRAAVRAVLGEDVEVRYYKPERTIEESMAAMGAPPSPKLIQQLHQPITIPLGFGWTELSEKHNGSSFCVADFNRSAHTAAGDLLNGNDKTLCLIGPRGTGKTHLGQCVLHQMESSGKRVAYVPSFDFRNNAVHAARNKTDGLDFYLRCFDCLFFDDIQFWKLNNSPSSFARFVEILAALMAKEIRLILAMHDWPRTYGFPAEMWERLHEGACAKIHEPSDQDRLDLVRFCARQFENIPDRIIVEMVQTPRNLRDYVGALKDLSRELRIGAAPASITSWMNERCGSVCAVELTIESIISAVEQAAGLSSGAIRGRGQKRDQARARHIAWYLMEQLLHMKQVAIAKDFGDMSSTTVCTTIKKISESTDPIVVININESKRLLGVAVEVE